jgi:DNA-binding Lrp family transcriptional regulator
LYDSDDRSYFAFSEKGPIKLDEKDQIILGLLENNSRMPNQDIAKKVKLTANAAKHRIERLVKEKVILNFRTKIVDEPLKYQFNHIMLTLQNMDKAKRDRLMSALCNDPLVYSIVESIGEADLEFEIHTKDSSELHNKLKELRSKFDFIKDHQTILLCQPSLLR